MITRSSPLADAVERQDLPFAVAMVASREDVLWQGSAGCASASTVAGPRTLFRIFSMTKAIGALAAIILVGRDLVSLDTPVTSVLPDFHEIQVLETIGRDGPVLRPPQRPVTLRHLLTNTSGFASPAWVQEAGNLAVGQGRAAPRDRHAGLAEEPADVRSREGLRLRLRPRLAHPHR